MLNEEILSMSWETDGTIHVIPIDRKSHLFKDGYRWKDHARTLPSGWGLSASMCSYGIAEGSHSGRKRPEM